MTGCAWHKSSCTLACVMQASKILAVSACVAVSACGGGSSGDDQALLAELMVEEYNPPCGYMGEKVASSYTTNSGVAISPTAFPKAAKLSRGIVGVVEVAGVINAGDAVSVEIYATPSWLIRSETE